MDTLTTHTTTLMEEFKKLFNHRRRQLQDWDSAPPHKLGFLILGLVALELVIARLLFHGQGLWAHLIPGFISTAIIILLFEGILLKTTAEFAQFFKKKGDWKTTFTFFNLGLFPMLLFLPITLAVWVCGGPQILRVLVFLFFALKVLSNWRESIEITHEFTRLQSTILMSSVIGIGSLLVVLLFYISLIGVVADFLSILR